MGHHELLQLSQIPRHEVVDRRFGRRAGAGLIVARQDAALVVFADRFVLFGCDTPQPADGFGIVVAVVPDLVRTRGVIRQSTPSRTEQELLETISPV